MVRRRDRSTSFFDLRDALSEPGCVVCRLNVDSADEFLDSLLWESVNDPLKRQEVRRSLGFCHKHAWLLVRASASVGVAIIAQDLFERVLETIDKASFDALPALSLRRVHEVVDSKQPSAATAGLVAQLTAQAPCPACVWEEKMERIYLDALVQNLRGEDGLLAEFEKSDGLCLPHFRQALACVRDRATFEALVSAQRAIWERLVDHLGESIRKNDYRFQHEAWGEESGAWLRAIAALVGTRPEKDRRKQQALWSFKQPPQG